MGTLAMPVNPYYLFGLPACRTARHHMRRCLFIVVDCRFLWLVAHAYCPIMDPISGQAVLSSGGAHPKYYYGKCQTRRPKENPRFYNCTFYMGLIIALSVGIPVLFASLLLLSPTKEVHAGKTR